MSAINIVIAWETIALHWLFEYCELSAHIMWKNDSDPQYDFPPMAPSIAAVVLEIINLTWYTFLPSSFFSLVKFIYLQNHSSYRRSHKRKITLRIWIIFSHNMGWKLAIFKAPLSSMFSHTITIFITLISHYHIRKKYFFIFFLGTHRFSGSCRRVLHTNFRASSETNFRIVTILSTVFKKPF